jgi:hypothetical protein
MTGSAQSSMVEHLPSMHKALGSIPHNNNNNNNNNNNLIFKIPSTNE